MQYHKTLLIILWQITDIVHEQTNNGYAEPTPDIMLARLIVPFKETDEKWETFTFKELLEMGLNCVNETTRSLYIKHVYNGADAKTFLGDALFGADRTIPIEERLDNVAKRVQKLTTSAKAAVGQSGRGGSTFGRRVGGRRDGFSNSYSGGKRQQHNKQGDYNNGYMHSGPPAFGRFNGNGSFGGSKGGWSLQRWGHLFYMRFYWAPDQSVP